MISDAKRRNEAVRASEASRPIHGQWLTLAVLICYRKSVRLSFFGSLAELPHCQTLPVALRSLYRTGFVYRNSCFAGGSSDFIRVVRPPASGKIINGNAVGQHVTIHSVFHTSGDTLLRKIFKTVFLFKIQEERDSSLSSLSTSMRPRHARSARDSTAAAEQLQNRVLALFCKARQQVQPPDEHI